MAKEHTDLNSSGKIRYAPWEHTFSKVLSPLEEFIHQQTASSILLAVATLIALYLANSSLAEHYQHVIHAVAGVNFNEWRLEMSLHHWVNDALMAIFFFVVGMELKREFLVGELSDIRLAALPVIAAIGGMVVPALIFAAFNLESDALRGWGVPMATDIAFAVGALVLLKNRVPKSLITFLIALAIADDLGAVLVIAIFYTANLVMSWLFAAMVLLLMLFAMNRAGIRNPVPYFIIAVLLWYAMLSSGIHATLAGVLGAFSVPVRSKYDPGLFVARVKERLDYFAHQANQDSSMMTNEQLHAITENIEHSVQGVQTPLQRLESYWHVPVAFLIIPIFALFNAGVQIDFSTLDQTVQHPVMMGVMAGLLFGKFLGITCASWLAIKLKWGRLPTDVNFSQIAAVSVLAGIGFTMSIFISELAYANQPEYLLMAKTGVIFASMLAGLIGFGWLWLLGQNKP